MTPTEAANRRRSIRKYTDQEVPLEVIDEIIGVASKSPSPWNLQPWRVVVVRDKEMKQKLMEVCYNQPQVGAASAVLVVYTDMADVVDHVDETIHEAYRANAEQHVEMVKKTFGDMSEKDRANWGRGFGYAFMAYLLLAATERGLGLSTMLGFDPDGVKKLLDIPAHAEIPVVIALGYPAEEGLPHLRHSVERIRRVI